MTKNVKQREAIADLLFSDYDGYSNAGIAHELGVDQSTSFATLKSMLESGEVEKIDKTYLITDFGISFYGLREKKAAENHLKDLVSPPPAPQAKTKSAGAKNVKNNTAEKIDKIVGGMEIMSHNAAVKLAPIVEKLAWVNPVIEQAAPPSPDELNEIEKELAGHFDDVFDGIDKRSRASIPVNQMSNNEIMRFKNGLRGDEQDAGAHYRYQYNGINIDPFRIAQIYGITDFALQTALKKILCAGKRGHKDLMQDLLDVRCAIDRKLEMLVEDGG